VSGLANREPHIDVIGHLRDLFPSSSHQVVLKLHRKSVLGKVQHIEIGSAELVSQDTGGEEIKGEHFFTFGWTSKGLMPTPLCRCRMEKIIRCGGYYHSFYISSTQLDIRNGVTSMLK